MPLIDFDKLAKEYGEVSGLDFTAISEAEYNSVADKAALTVEDYKARLKEVEKLIVPFLTKLHSTGDKEYIYWPNRKPAIEQQIERVLKLTRE
jgi:hypothetical protein